MIALCIQLNCTLYSCTASAIQLQGRILNLRNCSKFLDLRILNNPFFKGQKTTMPFVSVGTIS